MRIHMDLAGEQDAADWTERHARGEVPDTVPYGLDKLADHGVTTQFRLPVRNRIATTVARKVRNHTKQMDFVSTAIWALRHERRTADAILCWDERTGVPAALMPGGPPVASGAVWLGEEPERIPAHLRPLVARALRRMAVVFSCGEEAARQVERQWGLPAGSVRHLTMGVDEQFYVPQLPPETPGVVVSVGDDRRRDHDQLIRVMGELVDAGVATSLELATTSPGVDVPDRVGVLHRRRMEGAILDLYRRSSVVAVALQPSTGVFGITVALEAMACARPVVITANPGFEEYITHGETGLLVPAGDDDALREAIGSLLADPEGAAEMGRKARHAVEQRFTSAHLAERVSGFVRAARDVTARP